MVNPLLAYIEELCEATLYHGSPFPDIVECEEGICLAYNQDVAEEYAGEMYDFARNINPDGESKPTIYYVSVSDRIKIANTMDLRRAYSRTYRIPIKDIHKIEPDLYALADDDSVRRYLMAQGFDAIRFMDESPTMKPHKTLRILNPSVVKVIGKRKVYD